MTDMFDCQKANFSRLSGWGLPPPLSPLGSSPTRRGTCCPLAAGSLAELRPGGGKEIPGSAQSAFPGAHQLWSERAQTPLAKAGRTFGVSCCGFGWHPPGTGPAQERGASRAEDTGVGATLTGPALSLQCGMPSLCLRRCRK